METTVRKEPKSSYRIKGRPGKPTDAHYFDYTRYFHYYRIHEVREAYFYFLL